MTGTGLGWWVRLGLAGCAVGLLVVNWAVRRAPSATGSPDRLVAAASDDPADSDPRTDDEGDDSPSLRSYLAEYSAWLGFRRMNSQTTADDETRDIIAGNLWQTDRRVPVIVELGDAVDDDTDETGPTENPLTIRVRLK